MPNAPELSPCILFLDGQMRYKRWLWWTRFGMFITTLQFIAALYLMGVVAKDLSSGEFSKTCFSGIYDFAPIIHFE